MTWLPILPVAQWESLRRDLIWIRMAKVGEAHRDLLYHPKGVLAAWRLIRGSARFDLSGKTYRIKAGQWFFPGKTHGKRHFSKNAEIISIRFRVRWPDGESLFDHREPLLAKADSCLRLDEAGFALVHFVQEELSPEGLLLPQANADLPRYLQMRHHFEKWFEAYLEFMIAVGQRPALVRIMDERMVEVIRLLETKIQRGETLTEEELAKKSGLSLSQFKRLFVRDLRQTPKQWLDGKRMEIACERLRETRDAIKRVGYELGFRSPNHFSSWFQKLSGKTPTGFRHSAG